MTYCNIFDSHAHYDDPAFDADREELLARILPEAGVRTVVNCGADLLSSEASIALAARFGYFYAAVGIHPECVKDAPEDFAQRLAVLIGKSKVVAVGEIGLDYHFEENAPREVQIAAFERQVELANAHGLPVIIHDREAHGDTLEVLKRLKPAGVVHCFSGSVEMAREVLKLGMYIGLGGAVTFKNAKTPVEVAKMVPADRLLMETDCPYMTPVPFRGTRNDSSRIAYSAEKIAEFRGEEVQALLDQTRRNAEALFRIQQA
jgi:TatD DNase family protein